MPEPLYATRAVLPSGDVLGVVSLPSWDPCVVVVDVSGSLGASGTRRALAAANAVLAALPPRRQATAIAYGQRAVLSGLLAQAPRPLLSASCVAHVGLRVGCEDAAWDLLARELRRAGSSQAAEVVWISDFGAGLGAGPVAQGRLHRLAVRGREPTNPEVNLVLGPQGEVPAELLAELQPDPGDLQLTLDRPGRWFTWRPGALEPGPIGCVADLQPAAGSLAWVSVPQTRAHTNDSTEVPYAEGSPDADLLAAVREVCE